VKSYEAKIEILEKDKEIILEKLNVKSSQLKNKQLQFLQMVFLYFLI